MFNNYNNYSKVELKSIIAKLKEDCRKAVSASERRELRSTLVYFQSELNKLAARGEVQLS